jgi:hypothetical protein
VREDGKERRGTQQREKVAEERERERQRQRKREREREREQKKTIKER